MTIFIFEGLIMTVFCISSSFLQLSEDSSSPRDVVESKSEMPELSLPSSSVGENRRLESSGEYLNGAHDYTFSNLPFR